ncbi:Ldh family oxidoreductase [Paramicrobacterium chengjingii]|uniref:Ldh family oxidoreductase n=1 Tax=Paramicrobacterium chengjingii TaxID=2769067 RepID=UPI0014206DE3|nr:Ldh family oxidoreductase [Microbacterium chengjingii]
MQTVHLAPTDIHAVATDILQLLGTPKDSAALVADSLVGAQMVGHDSHGVVRLTEYASFVERRVVTPGATATVASQFAAISTVDGNHGWGQPAATFATRLAGDAAHDFGIGASSLRNCNHVGRIGEYAEQLAERGLVSIIWCNADPCVAPFGGRDRMLGTNPFAVGVPVDGAHPFILDFATAATAEGKLRVARSEGRDVPRGAIIDSQGNPSTDPSAFYDGGSLLPFGGHKGYAMSAFIELLGGGLSGNHPSITSRYRIGNGVVIVAMRPEAFDASDFGIDIGETIEALRASTPIDTQSPVLIPGDVEATVRAQRAESIPVGESIWTDVTRLRDSLSSSTRF